MNVSLYIYSKETAKKMKHFFLVSFLYIYKGNKQRNIYKAAKTSKNLVFCRCAASNCDFCSVFLLYIYPLCKIHKIQGFCRLAGGKKPCILWDFV